VAEIDAPNEDKFMVNSVGPVTMPEVKLNVYSVPYTDEYADELVTMVVNEPPDDISLAAIAQLNVHTGTPERRHCNRHSNEEAARKYELFAQVTRPEVSGQSHTGT
jgi:hypothetical protein